MVIGLAPIFLFWKRNVPAVSFHISVGLGVIMGIILATKQFPESLVFTEGKYADLLSANIIGTLLCFLGFWLPVVFSKKRP